MEMMRRLRRKRGDLPSLSSSLPSSLSSLFSPPPRNKRRLLGNSQASSSMFYVAVQDVALSHTVPTKLDWLLDQLLLDDEDNDNDDDVFADDGLADDDLGPDSGLETSYHESVYPYRSEGYTSDISYERACGGGDVGDGIGCRASPSAASTAVGAPPPVPRTDDHPIQPTPSSSRLQSFFSKHTLKSTRLKRTKSVTKLERSKRFNRSTTINNPNTANYQSTDSIGNDEVATPEVLPSWYLGSTASRLHASRSHESLLSANTVVNTLDLAQGEVTIKPLHVSILGQENCFQVTSPQGTRFFSCRSSEECDRWVESLRRAVGRTGHQQKRIDNELKMFILEAKGVALKKRYYCEILLDASLHGRTSSKCRTNICFWGEYFEFLRLPPTENITIALYRESEKKRRKEKSILIGFINIPVSEVSSRNYTEKWYPVRTESNKMILKDPIALRIKCKFQTLDILPMEIYNNLLQFIIVNYSAVVLVLEPTLNVKTKEDVATTLVKIMQNTGNASTFLIDIVTKEIERIGPNTSLLLRGNSVASKSMETYMKLVGDKYLRETLTPLVNTLLNQGMDCEVDPMKIKEISSLQKQQKNLLSVVKMAWSCILNSSTNFPQELQECFCLYRERFTEQGKADLINNLISSSIFLRFLCPAIMSPSLFNIIREYPSERASRNLTLVAKTLQTLANFTKFQGKENYMEFMNDFIESEQDQMRSFLFKISSPADEIDGPGSVFEGEIDLGKQLSILHIMLTETLDNISSPSISNSNRHLLDSLHRILEEIAIAKKQTNNNVAVKHAKSTGPAIHSVSLSVLQNDKKLSMQNFDDSNSSLLSDESLSYQSLQRTTEATSPTSLPSVSSTPNTARSSTLPRNSFLIGSAKKAAINLHTADDYVLYSALEKELPNAGDPIEHNHIQNNLTPRPSFWSNWSNGPTWSTPNNKITSNTHSHHHHFHNHYGGFVYKNKLDNTIDSQKKCDKSEESPSLSPDDIEDTESSNDHGSSSSLSLLSNMASSGYQSFGYSQSSSPVDPTIAQQEMIGNNAIVSNKTHSSPQLNPMYHLHKRQIGNQNEYHSSQSSTPEMKSQRSSNAGCTPHQHYHPLRKLSLTNPIPATLTPFSSVEDLSTTSIIHGQDLSSAVSLDPSSLGSLLSPIQHLPISHSSSSEDLCHPDFRSRLPLHAPRTNPRYLPPGRVCSTTGWGSGSMPGHHHSASDLSTSLAWRSKMTRSQSSFKRSHDWRFQCESDSSDCEASLSHPSFSIHQFNQKDFWHNISQQPRSETQRKSLKEYEKEITRMRTAMEDMKHKLLSSEPENTSKTDINNANLQETQHKQQSEEISNEDTKSEKKDTVATIPSMKDLLQKLLILQAEFKNEKCEMQSALVAKDMMITEQEKRITALHRTNNQLINALTRVKHPSLGQSGDLGIVNVQEQQSVNSPDQSSS